MSDLNIVGFLNLVFDLLNQGIVKLNYFTGIFENKMIMLPVKCRFLELRVVCPELMFGYKATIQQEFYRIIQCSPADPVLVVFHPDI